MILVLNAEEGEVLKSFGSVSRNGKGVIKIEIEFTALDQMGWALSNLQHVATEQLKPKVKAQLLGLPSPDEFK